MYYQPYALTTALPQTLDPSHPLGSWKGLRYQPAALVRWVGVPQCDRSLDAPAVRRVDPATPAAAAACKL